MKRNGLKQANFTRIIPESSYVLNFFGDLDKSFSLGDAHASMALRSLNHDFIVHEALLLVLRLFG